MKLDDEGLVQAPRWLVHRRLVAVAEWSTWWPGLVVVEPSAGPGVHHHLAVATGRAWRPRRTVRLAVLPWGERPDKGIHLAIRGDVVADAELWYADVRLGTIVHHLAEVDERSRGAGSWRSLVRRALWALDDRLGDEVRRAVLPAPATGRGPSVANE